MILPPKIKYLDLKGGNFGGSIYFWIPFLLDSLLKHKMPEIPHEPNTLIGGPPKIKYSEIRSHFWSGNPFWNLRCPPCPLPPDETRQTEEVKEKGKEDKKGKKKNNTESVWKSQLNQYKIMVLQSSRPSEASALQLCRSTAKPLGLNSSSILSSTCTWRKRQVDLKLWAPNLCFPLKDALVWRTGCSCEGILELSWPEHC